MNKKVLCAVIATFLVMGVMAGCVEKEPSSELHGDNYITVEQISKDSGLIQKYVDPLNEKGVCKKHPEYAELIEGIHLCMVDYEDFNPDDAEPLSPSHEEAREMLIEYCDFWGGEPTEEYVTLIESWIEEARYTSDEWEEMGVVQSRYLQIEDEARYTTKDMQNKSISEILDIIIVMVEKRTSGICTKFPQRMISIKKVVEKENPKLRDVIIEDVTWPRPTMGIGGHAGVELKYFDGDTLIITQIDPAEDKVDCKPFVDATYGDNEIGRDNTYTDLSAIDKYHAYRKK